MNEYTTPMNTTKNYNKRREVSVRSGIDNTVEKAPRKRTRHPTSQVFSARHAAKSSLAVPWEWKHANATRQPPVQLRHSSKLSLVALQLSAAGG